MSTIPECTQHSRMGGATNVHHRLRCAPSMHDSAVHPTSTTPPYVLADSIVRIQPTWLLHAKIFHTVHTKTSDRSNRVHRIECMNIEWPFTPPVFCSPTRFSTFPAFRNVSRTFDLSPSWANFAQTPPPSSCQYSELRISTFWRISATNSNFAKLWVAERPKLLFDRLMTRNSGNRSIFTRLDIKITCMSWYNETHVCILNAHHLENTDWWHRPTF